MLPRQAMPPKEVHVPADANTLEAEADDYSDRDSAFASLGASSTTSIGSSILKYREENGRTYHAYKEGKYPLPNDEVSPPLIGLDVANIEKGEKDRLDLQHHLYILTYGNKLFLAPIPKETPLHRVLDVGTGTGIWAIDFADEHPESQVLGVDLSPIQPMFLPPNLSFEIDDLEEPWNFGQKFDFIYSRMLTGSFADWPRFFEQSLQNLHPGGYLEVSDLTFPTLVDDDTYPENSALKRWGVQGVEASIKLGRPINSAESYKQQMIDAGFEDVIEVKNKWPTNRWPKDRHMKELGMWNHENIAGSLSGLTMAMYTRGLGWTAEEVEVFCTEVRKEMRDTKIHAYFDIYTVYGRKPKLA
ncbi:methyltransferase domain-containing protein [Phlyctema vagabunda]|uniref:Methyltransferase domain-containing protein n=1 Tax=Phlyctema vagabunda TaxID=108571 RepID=A0ABR4P8A4_9HELO